MELLADPSIWAGLVTLIILEIILGIDNLVFIAILADKVKPELRDRARIIGLSLALLMRIVMLSGISWLITLTDPIFTVFGHSVSERDLILLMGGLFLLFKATMELHERLEGHTERKDTNVAYLSFWVVLTQIVLLDAVFSLDSVITAVGMVDHLWVMIVAVIIAMAVMMLASKPLTTFVNSHPTVVILCLCFLLMIGFSLIAEGFGFSIPKGYLYAAIGFSILIEFFNQTALHNQSKQEARIPMRQRTADTILRMLGSAETVTTNTKHSDAPTTEVISSHQKKDDSFAAEERYMITGVLTLAERSIRTIMTPRGEISWIDCNDELSEIEQQLLAAPHSMFPVCRDSLDNVIGVVHAKELLKAIYEKKDLAVTAAKAPPVLIPDKVDVLRSLNVLRNAQGSLVLVVDEYASIQGLLTPLDVLEAIAGEFPDADEVPDLRREDGSIYAQGLTNLHHLELALGGVHLNPEGEDIATLSGLILNISEQIPEVGANFTIAGLHFEVLEVSEQRVELVKITPQGSEL